MKFLVQAVLEYAGDRWLTLATCASPEAAGEVIRILLSQADLPTYYRIEIVHD